MDPLSAGFGTDVGSLGTLKGNIGTYCQRGALGQPKENLGIDERRNALQ